MMYSLLSFFEWLELFNLSYLCQIVLCGIFGEGDVCQWCSILQKVLGCTTIFSKNVPVLIVICVLSRKNCWSCCKHVNITKLKVVLFFWRNFCFVPNWTLLQCPSCNMSLKSTSSIFKLCYLLAQFFLFAYMRRHHVNLKTTLSMNHSNRPVVIQMSLGPLPIHIVWCKPMWVKMLPHITPP